MDDNVRKAFFKLGKKGGVNITAGEILYKLALECKSPILEFGSLRGRSTMCLGAGSKDGHGAAVYAVDGWQFSPKKSLTEKETEELESLKKVDNLEWNLKIFGRHMKLAGVADYVKPCPGSLYDFEYDGQIGMVFCDADKSREGMNHLWDRFWPKIDSGGWFISHDFSYQLVEKDGQMLEKFEGIKDWFIKDVYPKHRREWEYGEINQSMCLIQKP